MMRCKKCDQVSARLVNKRQLRELSKRHFSGPAVASATVPVAAVVAATAGSSASGLIGKAIKGATKGPKEMIIAGAITAAVAGIGAAVKYGFSKLESGDKAYAYCSNCGHYEQVG